MRLKFIAAFGDDVEHLQLGAHAFVIPDDEETAEADSDDDDEEADGNGGIVRMSTLRYHDASSVYSSSSDDDDSRCASPVQEDSNSKYTLSVRYFCYFVV